MPIHNQHISDLELQDLGGELSSDGFVASAAASIATGWSEPVRAGVAPAEVQRLFTAHCYASYLSSCGLTISLPD